MCADIYTKAFGPALVHQWNNCRRNINVLAEGEDNWLIGRPGPGWENWRDNPHNYTRQEHQKDPWEGETAAASIEFVAEAKM